VSLLFVGVVAAAAVDVLLLHVVRVFSKTIYSVFDTTTITFKRVSPFK